MLLFIFQVTQNIRMVDKSSSIDSGVVRIGFIVPEEDVVKSCSNRAELKMFMFTIEVVQHLTPLRCESGTTCCCPDTGFFSTFSENCISCAVIGSPNVSDTSILVLYGNSRIPSVVTMDTIMFVVQRLCPVCNCVIQCQIASSIVARQQYSHRNSTETHTHTHTHFFLQISSVYTCLLYTSRCV